jgi:PIN domain nuclease of toxin-antitoxin system
MRVLLDTHAFLWWNLGSPQLSEKARDIIAGGQAEIFVSAATAWEIALKARKGRLVLPAPPDRYVIERLAYYRFQALPVLVSHACQTFHLPDYHTDPFDRLLVAQCQVEKMSLVSADELLSQYPVDVIW